jgi:SulP family sulfate permease
MEKKGPSLKYVILNAEPISYMDSSAVNMLEGLIRELTERDIQFMVAAAIGPTRDILNSSGTVALLGEENFFVQTMDAVAFAREHKERSTIQRKVSSQTLTKSS